MLAVETSVSPIQMGCKVICAPCVGHLFHQTVVGWSGHDLCSWLLGAPGAERQKARLHGNKTAGICAGKIYWERYFHRMQAESVDGFKFDANKPVNKCKKADETDRLKTQSVSDSDNPILNHSVDGE